MRGAATPPLLDHAESKRRNARPNMAGYLAVRPVGEGVGYGAGRVQERHG